MNRRSFLKALGIGAATIAVAPIFVLSPAPVRLKIKKLMARVRLTEEGMQEFNDQAFTKASADQMNQLKKDIYEREISALVNSGSSLKSFF